MDKSGINLQAGGALLIATRKGLFTLQGNTTDGWCLSDPLFLGHIINHAVLDPRNGTSLVVASSTGHLGPTIFRSQDTGKSWCEASRPPAFDKAQSGQTARTVSHTFWLTPGHVSEPGTWFAGTSPQALWISEDAGDTWHSVRGFNDHPDYELRCEDPQAGTPDGPVMHSILVDPRDAQHMYLSLSGGGVYESLDHGSNWSPLNQGMATVEADPGTGGSDANPGSLPWNEVGPEHDPHSVLLHPANPDILYQQNHCGIYRLQRPATRWERIGNNMPAAVGDIGFVVGLHPTDADRCWVFPMDGTDVWPRTSPDGRPALYTTKDAGKSWHRQDTGLPVRAWFTVKRQGLATDNNDPLGLYFGTTSGEVWASADAGGHWQCVAQHLPEIYAVECCELT